MVVTNEASSDSKLPSLRERVREAAGWYAWINAKLIRMAGPASRRPIRDDSPAHGAGARRAGVLRSAASLMTAHTFDRSGPRPLMHCP